MSGIVAFLMFFAGNVAVSAGLGKTLNDAALIFVGLWFIWWAL